MARSQLLVFSFPSEAGLCPYIAGPALPVSAIARALLPFLRTLCHGAHNPPSYRSMVLRLGAGASLSAPRERQTRREAETQSPRTSHEEVAGLPKGVHSIDTFSAMVQL
jgi:hypothetical protein